MRRRITVAAGIAVVLVAGAAAVATGVLPGIGLGTTAEAATSAPGAPVTTATVERGTVATSADLDGTLGYEGSQGVTAGAAGTLTRLPDAGDVIERGEVLYELDGRVRPRLLYGERPLWRPMEPGMSDGADVRQLEQNLRALGHAPRGMTVDRHWDARTTRAVRRWQAATGRAEDGTLDGGDLAFLPGAVRVASLEAELGGRVAPGTPVLGTSTATHVVTLDISAGRQDLVAPGQAVSVELPDGAPVAGSVREVGRVAQAGENGSATTVPVTIDLDAAANLPDLDAAPVTVSVVTQRHEDVLTVPVTALLALLEGGYAVETVGADGTRAYVAVETGLFEGGRVEVAADGLATGDVVVVSR